MSDKAVEETKEKVEQLTIQPEAEAEAEQPVQWELSQTDHLNKKLLSSFLQNTNGKDLLAMMTKNKPEVGPPSAGGANDEEWED